MSNAYFLRFEKGRIPLDRLEYPCEKIEKGFLKQRTLCLYGMNVEMKDELDKLFGIFHPECHIKNDLANCTDLIVLPTIGDIVNEDYESYYKELHYYYDVTLSFLWKNKCAKNIILLLPSDADKYSTNYKRMADYAIIGFGEGLSKQYVSKGINTYVLLIDREIHRKSLFEILIYLLSNNSNHFVAKTLKLR